MSLLTTIIEKRGLTILASQLNVTYQAVRKWERQGVPADRVLRLCEILDWEFTPHQLRPDIYPHSDDGLPECRRGGQRLDAA